MRCKECRVDLGENVKVCPLCGSAATDEKPMIENMKTAEYPEYGELRPLKYYIQKNDVYFGKWMMVGIVALSAVILAVSEIFNFLDTALYIVLPAIYAAAAIVYFLSSFKDKKHSRAAIYFIMLALFDGVITLVGYITTKGIGQAYFALGSGVVALLSLMLLATKYPREIDDELAGRLHR
ncbi:MAG: hypothetical protein J6L89_01665 [Clostridia bacterium]|nr:hypothetical protein [Clostridia bacterium]